MVTKMADKTGLKQRNCHFGPTLRLLETDFLRIRYQHMRIPNKPFDILCVMINSHPLLKYIFGIACALC